MRTRKKIKYWHKACEMWDYEMITTEKLRRKAPEFFTGVLLSLILEEIEIVDLCGA